MKRLQNNIFAKLLLGLMLCIPAIFAPTVYADNVQNVKTFSVNGWSQGAVLTKKYYVYTDWSGNSFKVIRCDRSDGGNCKSSATFSGKPSSMYHKWGTDYAQAILKKSSGMYCIKLSTMEKSSGCGSMLSSSGLSANGDIDGARQGWTKYGNYYMRGYGNNGGMQNYIWVFNSSKNIVKKWAIPLSGGEVEDVMVDGDTGQVWFTWYGSSRHITYYKVAQSVFSEYFNPSSQSSSSSSDSGSSSSIVPPSKKEPYNPSQSTYDGSVATTYFGNLQDDDEGCGVFTVLNFIIDILTFGIAIAAAIGIGLAGTTYLTAKGNVAQATKAKRRLYEIIIGLAVYAVLYVGLNFLLPGGNWSINKTCEAASSSSRAVTGKDTPKQSSTKEKTEAAKQEATAKNKAASDESKAKTAAEKVASTAEALAWPSGTAKAKWAKCWDGCKKTSKKAKPYGKSTTLAKKYGVTANLYDCGGYVQLVTTVVRGKKTKSLLHAALSSFKKFKTLANQYHYKAFNWDGKMSSLKRGDILVYKWSNKNAQHIYIYLGNNRVANANFTPGDKKYYAHIIKVGAGNSLRSKANKKFVYVARPTG